MEVAGGTTRGGDHSKEVTRSLQLLPSSLSLSLQEDCSSFSSWWCWVFMSRVADCYLYNYTNCAMLISLNRITSQTLTISQLLWIPAMTKTEDAGWDFLGAEPSACEPPPPHQSSMHHYPSPTRTLFHAHDLVCTALKYALLPSTMTLHWSLHFWLNMLQRQWSINMWQVQKSLLTSNERVQNWPLQSTECTGWLQVVTLM